MIFFIPHNGHSVKLGNHSAIHSCRVVLLCVVREEGQESVHHLYRRNAKEPTVGAVKLSGKLTNSFDKLGLSTGVKSQMANRSFI